MASTITRARKKAYADTLAAKTLRVALFVNINGYDPVTATTLAALRATATEVSNVGTGYTTGGYPLVLTAANVGATNVSMVTATATTVAAATFTCRYGVIYEVSTGNIEGISDFGADYTVTAGTIEITWDATNGLFNIA